MEKAADMVHVIRNTKTAPNQIGNAGIRPSVARITVGHGAVQKHVAELLSIVDGQLARTSRGW